MEYSLISISKKQWQKDAKNHSENGLKNSEAV